MKDRVREAIFNVLGNQVVDRHVLDLFAGTGALGLEALSRGAASATFLELDRPTADRLRATIRTFGLSDRARVILTDTFRWARGRPELPPPPWLVFCSPPYAMYHDRPADLRDLFGRLRVACGDRGVWVVETPESFDPTSLAPDTRDWDVRHYRPCRVGLYWGSP